MINADDSRANVEFSGHFARVCESSILRTMIAIPRRLVSGYDARLRSLASLTVVAFVWASMLVVALGLVYRYGPRTLPQYDEVWALYDSGPAIHINWLWKTWAEHRIPLAKLIWKGVLQWTNYDFRAGDFDAFTVWSHFLRGELRLQLGNFALERGNGIVPRRLGLARNGWQCDKRKAQRCDSNRN